MITMPPGLMTSAYPNSQNQPINADQAPKNSTPSNTRADKADVSDVDQSTRADNFDVDALVNRIWGFTSGRIESAERDGASQEKLDGLWEAAEQGVAQGFGEAKSILEDMGLLDDELALKIETSFQSLMGKLDARDLSPSLPVNAASVRSEVNSLGNSLTANTSFAQYERQTFSLSLMTEQGDQIEIRSIAEQYLQAEDSQFGQQSQTQWQAGSASGFSLFIKGDLNAQERLDLDALLTQVNELATEFYKGDYQTAFEMASDLNIDGTSLRSLDLSLGSVEQSGASAYAAEQSNQSKLPQGLSLLKEYAEKLIEIQQEWAETFNAPSALLAAFENHPMNDGNLSQTATSLLNG